VQWRRGPLYAVILVARVTFFPFYLDRAEKGGGGDHETAIFLESAYVILFTMGVVFCRVS
jgi:hypothetical protein